MKSLKQNLRGDIIGGITVAIVALPLAIAFGMQSMPGDPNAAIAGLYGAIFCGLFATIFGATPGLINGPTAAMIVVLAGAYTGAGYNGFIMAMLIAGAMQILLGILKLGKLVQFIPKPVVVGFTNGIAISIFTGQFGDFATAPILAIIVICVMFIPIIAKWIYHFKKENSVVNGIKKFFQVVPASLIGLIIAVTVSVLWLKGAEVITDRATITTGFPMFKMPVFNGLNWSVVISSAISLCLLASIESLLSAVVVDEMLDQKSNPNRELIGQGIGNFIAPLFGGLIGTGAIVRSAVNVNNGGRTKLSGIIHALIILLIVVCFAGIMKYIPMAALAGILMVTAFNMMEFDSFAKIGKVPYCDSLVMIVTMIVTVVEDLIVGVACGTILALLLILVKKLSSKKKVLFFGNIGKTVEQLSKEEGDVVSLNLGDVGIIDESAVESLIALKTAMEKKGKKLVLTNADETVIKVFSKMKCADGFLCNSPEATAK
ncbi:MAG: SulP family inorganic anion transporter [Clostridia bacterium]|nr:SulP family inorganic anion transporter [Clostridia bacterium]